MTDALDAVVDAAVERALVGGSDPRRYFALAGALERVRTGGRDRTDGRGPTDGREEAGMTPPPVDRLGAALASVVAVRALDASDSAAIAADAWTPGGDDPHAALVAVGAVAACRRFDVDLDRVAARSGVDRAELARRLESE
ncbi:hypothetical protein [Halobellus rarus]|uniref:Uncharacterized protein n=1 Tax=Halobellus rarus TaxID=1126237 RepID=A0ABD6CPI5_9EURY|nr:hypothetical protein [Halobellus rarus]